MSLCRIIFPAKLFENFPTTILLNHVRHFETDGGELEGKVRCAARRIFVLWCTVGPSMSVKILLPNLPRCLHKFKSRIGYFGCRKVEAQPPKQQPNMRPRSKIITRTCKGCTTNSTLVVVVVDCYYKAISVSFLFP